VERTNPSLLERLRHSDQTEAWRRFVDLYTPLIYFWACRMGLAAQEAAEVVKEVFATLAQSVSSFTPARGTSFRGWLRSVTRSQWHDNRRRHAAALRYTETVAVADVAAPDAAEALWDTEYWQLLVGRALEVMRIEFEPAVWKTCWSLVVEGKPAPQLAVEMGVSVESVYAAQSSVLRRLRQELDGLLD
jgi:RNA polymerase sigma-70 factor (ECF subfamily)